jgi:hypothetical protein
MKRFMMAALVVSVAGVSTASAEVGNFGCRTGSNTTAGDGGDNISCNQLKRGETYTLRAQGSWLDITSSVTGPTCVAASIIKKVGVVGMIGTIYVRLQMASNCALGDKRITLRRPALGGTDSDSIMVKVVP